MVMTIIDDGMNKQMHTYTQTIVRHARKHRLMRSKLSVLKSNQLIGANGIGVDIIYTIDTTTIGYVTTQIAEYIAHKWKWTGINPQVKLTKHIEKPTYTHTEHIQITGGPSSTYFREHISFYSSFLDNCKHKNVFNGPSL